MSNSNFKIKHVADLARLSLEDDEADRLQGDLEEILNYVKSLQELDTENTDEIDNITNLFSVAREDVACRKNDVKKTQVEDIRRQFPKTKDNYVKIVRILNR